MAGNCEHGQLRLMEGNDDEQEQTRAGRLEICINNAWGSVCQDLFNLPDAMVACNHLNGFHHDEGLCVVCIHAYIGYARSCLLNFRSW